MSSAPLNLSLRQLRAFVAIARLASFTRAAEQMHVSQAGLSGMLRDVETQLGCRLFDRTTRHVSLTEQGRTLLPVATRVLLEIDSAHTSVGLLTDMQRRTLIVGATPLVASCILPALCAAFAADYPRITVIVRDLGRGAIEDGVRAGEIDAGFGVFLDEASGVRRVRLMRTPLMLVTAEAAPEPTRGVSRWSDLKTVRLVGLPPPNPIQQCVDAQLARVGRANEARATFNYLHTLLAMVDAGAGSAILPSFVAAATRLYRVRLTRITQPKVDVEFFEITHAGRPRNPVVAAFSALLKRTLTENEPRRRDGSVDQA